MKYVTFIGIVVLLTVFCQTFLSKVRSRHTIALHRNPQDIRRKRREEVTSLTYLDGDTQVISQLSIQKAKKPGTDIVPYKPNAIRPRTIFTPKDLQEIEEIRQLSIRSPKREGIFN